MQFCKCIYGAQLLWHTKFVEVRHPSNQMLARAVLLVHLWSTMVTGLPSLLKCVTHQIKCRHVQFCRHIHGAQCLWHTKFVEVRHPSDQMQARAVLQVHLWSTVVMAYQVC